MMIVLPHEGEECATSCHLHVHLYRVLKIMLVLVAMWRWKCGYEVGTIIIIITTIIGKVAVVPN